MDNIYGKKLNQEKLPLLYIILLILFQIALVNLENLRMLNDYNSEIHMIIIGNGSQDILNSNFQFEPSEVIVNGYKDDSCEKTCYLSKDLNNITLKFSNQINSCEKMFKSLNNIKEIDLSNFDASKITSMNEMFQGCSNLASVILSNSNTYNLINISFMFHNCSNLEIINFGNINKKLINFVYYNSA